MIELILIGLCILCSFFFSGSETALTAISRARLFQLIKEGNKRAELVRKLRDKKDALIGTLLLGNTIVNIAAGSVGTILAIKWWGQEWGPLYGTFFTTWMVLVFAEVLPKTLAIHYSERFSLIVARPLYGVVILFSPITRMVQWLVRGLLKRVGIDVEKSDSLISATDVIRGTIEMHHHEGDVEKTHKDMLGSILDLSEREVGEVMVHRKHVYAIDMAQEPEAIINQALATVHSRIPLYQGSPDNIVGVLHIKDILKLVINQKIGITREMIRRVATRPWFVPETTPLNDQLHAFQERRKHFACVVNEYGTFLGVVTLEDIIEEIVGEIDDEHDTVGVDDIIPFGEKGYRVEGTVTIRDLNRHLEWNLPDDHANTIAGLILHEAEMIPDQGAVFEFYGVRFIIAKRTGNQITQLVLELVEADDDDDGYGNE